MLDFNSQSPLVYHSDMKSQNMLKTLPKGNKQKTNRKVIGNSFNFILLLFIKSAKL